MKKTEVSDELLKNLICIAIFGGNDTTARTIIEKELSSANIVHYVEGSVVYNVLVFKKDVNRALEILKNSEGLKKRWHQLIE